MLTPQHARRRHTLGAPVKARGEPGAGSWVGGVLEGGGGEGGTHERAPAGEHAGARAPATRRGASPTRDAPDDTGTAGWSCHPALPIEPADLVIEKRVPDAFDGTSLQQELAARGIRMLVIAGMQTELCIDATCRRAAALGYDVALVADGHSTFDGSRLSAADIIAPLNAPFGPLATLPQGRHPTVGTR